MTIPCSLCTRIAQELTPFMASVLLLAGCNVSYYTAPEYDRVLASARTDCKGNEIVGVWESSIPGSEAGYHLFYTSNSEFRPGAGTSVVLFRPDGTGLYRDIFPAEANVTWGNKTVPFLWHYKGAGVWTWGAATIRYAGNALTLEQAGRGAGGARYVYIRSGNESLNGR